MSTARVVRWAGIDNGVDKQKSRFNPARRSEYAPRTISRIRPNLFVDVSSVVAVVSC
jgi:hypothetical protein